MSINQLTTVAMDYWQGRKCHKERRPKEVVVEPPGPVLYPALKATAATDLYNASCNLIKQAVDSRGTTQGVNLAKRWFSARVNLSDLYTKVDTLASYLQTTQLKVRFARDKQLLGAYDPSFETPQVVQLGKAILWKRYSWGEKVMTFLHEASHAILGTRDLCDGETGFSLGACYGWYAYRLAQGDLRNVLARLSATPQDTINNAENWGYYFVSHHELITADRAEKLAHVGTHDFAYIDPRYLRNAEAYMNPRLPPRAPMPPETGPAFYDATYYVAEITDIG